MATLTRTQRIARYAEWIEAAETALHTLALGDRPVTVRYGEKEVSYGVNDAKKLQDYIAYLRRQCGGGRSVIRIIPN